MFKYQIGDKIYIQKPLVLGQMLQLTEHLKGLRPGAASGPEGLKIISTSPFEIIKTLGDKLPSALAIVLTEEGKSPRDKDIESMAAEISFAIDLETTFKVIEDFFDCNPISLNFRKLIAVMERISEKIPKVRTGSGTSLSSSLEETSPGEMKSSGDLHSENASPSPDI